MLFCGINPSLYSAATGYHFARPGNRFWPALELGGFTPRRLQPQETAELLAAGCGITNVVARATATAAELDADELRQGAVALEQRVARWRPRALAVLGVGAYRTGFARSAAVFGRQAEDVAGVPVWVLPNPSGLNAHYSLTALGELFGRLREAVATVT